MLHLLHPALVHFSVAFLGVGGACEAWAILRRRAGVERWAGVLVVVGTLSLLPTIVTGYLAKNSVTLPANAAADLELHERLGLTLAGVFVASQFWKAWGGGRIAPRYRTWYAVLLLAGVAVLVIGAILGGELVYGHGVGVVNSS